MPELNTATLESINNSINLHDRLEMYVFLNDEPCSILSLNRIVTGTGAA